MAYEGELVKLTNGRWARFRRLPVAGESKPWTDDTVLVAVEVEEGLQALLERSGETLDEYARRGEQVQVRLEGDALRFEPEGASLH